MTGRSRSNDSTRDAAAALKMTAMDGMRREFEAIARARGSSGQISVLDVRRFVDGFAKRMPQFVEYALETQLRDELGFLKETALSLKAELESVTLEELRYKRTGPVEHKPGTFTFSYAGDPYVFRGKTLVGVRAFLNNILKLPDGPEFTTVDFGSLSGEVERELKGAKEELSLTLDSGGTIYSPNEIQERIGLLGRIVELNASFNAFKYKKQDESLHTVVSNIENIAVLRKIFGADEVSAIDRDALMINFVRSRLDAFAVAIGLVAEIVYCEDRDAISKLVIRLNDELSSLSVLNLNYGGDASEAVAKLRKAGAGEAVASDDVVDPRTDAFTKFIR